MGLLWIHGEGSTEKENLFQPLSLEFQLFLQKLMRHLLLLKDVVLVGNLLFQELVAN